VAKDIIEVVERSYVLDGSEQEWLQNLASSAEALLDQGLGILALIYQAHPGGRFEIRTAAGSGISDGLLSTVIPFALATPPEIVETTYLHRTGCAAASEITRLGAELERHPAWQSIMHPHGMHDYRATNVLVDPRGRGCIVGAPLPRVTRTPPTLRRAWNRVAAHIGAGLRLRYQLGSADPTDGATAILSPSGRVEHAVEDARDSSAQSQLRRAALAVDRARSKLRREDPGQALELWQALVSGRWSLVDHHEHDGRRYLIARRNDPGVSDPRALSLRERQVAWYAALGHPNKLIGYELGISMSSVATHLKLASKKLGVRSRPELIALVRGLVNASDATC
jgi:DNA-binding CsgD family transcriptional regulator